MKTSVSSLARIALAAGALFFQIPDEARAAEDSKTPALAATDVKALSAQVGREVAVEGVVTSAGRGPKDGVRFLNFTETRGAGFVAAIFPSAYSGLQPLEDYTGKTVRVTGDLASYREQMQIKVFKADQIEILPQPEKDSPAAGR